MRNRNLPHMGILLAALMIFPLANGVYSQEPTLQSADQLRDEKSFRLAAGEYDALLNSGDLGPKTKREIQFKFADSSWRTHEQVRYEEAIKLLKELIESESNDRWWAEASESLADHYLMVNRYQHQQEIKTYYENAREFWAGSKNINLARKRFIGATFKLGDYISTTWGWYYRDIRPIGVMKEVVDPRLPHNTGLEVLYKDILKIVKSDEDKAKVYYSLAMSYYQNYNRPEDKEKSATYFEKVIKEFPESEWTDDAYYQLGQYYQQKNEFKKALKTYRTFLTHFRYGESQFVNNAKRQIEEIGGPQLHLNSSYTYLPGSEVEFNLRWRNIDGAKVTVYKLDLTEELRFNLSKKEIDYARGISNYQEMIKLLVSTHRYEGLPQALSWHLNLKNEGKHLWHGENKGLAEWRQHDEEEEVDPKKGILEPGAYLVMAAGSGVKAYDLILVTDMGVVTKTAGHSALFYVFDAQNGEPRAGAKVKYQYRYYDDQGHWRWDQGQGVTDESGLLKVSLLSTQRKNYNNQHQLFTTVLSGPMQTFSQGNYYHYNYQNSQWRIYAYSDRPAYRPNEEVSFKATLRIDNGRSYQTPSQKKIKAWIYDARGNKVLEKVYVLNDFGTFHDAFTLDEKATLGEYTLNIYSEDQSVHLGSTTLTSMRNFKSCTESSGVSKLKNAFPSKSVLIVSFLINVPWLK